MNRRRLSADRITAIVVMAVMLGYGYQSLQFSKALRSDVVGPTLYPIVLAICGMILAGILFIRPGANEEHAADERGAVGIVNDLIPWGMMLGYVALLPAIGFHLATFLFVFLMLKLLRQPTWLGAAGLALCVVAVTHFLFYALLNIRLPMGMFRDLLGG